MDNKITLHQTKTYDLIESVTEKLEPSIKFSVNEIIMIYESVEGNFNLVYEDGFNKFCDMTCCDNTKEERSKFNKSANALKSIIKKIQNRMKEE